MKREPVAKDMLDSGALELLPSEVGPAAAMGLLEAKGKAVGVYVDDPLTSKRPRLVIGEGGRGAAKVRGVGPRGEAELFVFDEDTTLRAIVEEVGVMPSLSAGAPGVVIVDVGRAAIGVLTADRLRRFFENERLSVTRGLGEQNWFGSFTQPRLKVTCSTCNAVNDLSELVVGRTKCKNGHLLTVDWE